jgi:site-specific DNA recombinase
MRTIIYARFSSDQLQNARSIDDQVAVCRARADREGWPIVAVETDAGISGAAGLAARPGLEAALAAIERGEAEQLLAESTDRIARHQGDSFAILERIEHAGARLFTLSDGEVDDIKGTIKGLLDARFRKELKSKIRRGQSGTVREGRVAAGLAYGYRVANRLDDRGNVIRGLREIEADQAAIVRRIFAEYLRGDSPRAIAARLNAEGVPGPRGGQWRGSTIGGDRQRGNGLIRNRLYVGEIVHHRTSKVTDPQTRRQLIRANAARDHEVGRADHLRIVDQATWEKVQAMRESFALMGPQGAKRPKHLFSGLVVCGVCGGGYNIVSARLWRCGRYHDGRACTNNRQIETQTLERRVLAGLKEKILSAEAVSLFVREYTAERGKAQRALASDRSRLTKAAKEAETRIANLVAAIAAGGDEFAEVREALAQARQERDAAHQALAEIEAEESVVTLHPRLAELYRARVEDLIAQLAIPERRVESMPVIRSLVDRIVLTPAKKGRGCDVRLEGRLTGLLAAASGRPAEGLPTVSVERVKGTRRKHRFLRAKV